MGEAGNGFRRFVRHHRRDRQRAEHARRNVRLFLGRASQSRQPSCGNVRGVCIELCRAERTALEHQRSAPVGASETCACAVECVHRLAIAAIDLEHAPQCQRDRDLSGHIGGGSERGLEISRRLRVPGVRLGEAEREQDLGAQPLGGRLGQRPA